MGLEGQREAIQLNSIDAVLRVALYNYLHKVFHENWWYDGHRLGCGYEAARQAWTDFWHQPIDKLTDNAYEFVPVVKKFVLEGQWNKVYDFIEFLVGHARLGADPKHINSILEREMSGYRFRGRILVPISDPTELAAIEQAMEAPDKFKGSRQHIISALKKLSQKPRPDLRNAITEAISAVESAARVVTGKPKATLGDALKVLEKGGHVHPSLKEAWLKIYGYTSDEQGLRHAMIEDPHIDLPTAKYMVVSCAAFVNLLSMVP
jgi:DNA-binding transcriptional ArsR family regulator